MKESIQVIEIMDELKNAAVSGFKSKHDDAIDTISMLSVMNPWKPSEEIQYEMSVSGGSSMWIELDDEASNSRNSLIF
jgi:hypothetical protein